MKSLTEALQYSINESRIDELMLQIRNMNPYTPDDFEELQYDIEKLPDNDLLKFTEEFFWMLIYEVGIDIPNNDWNHQAKNDPNYGKHVKGIQCLPGGVRYSEMMYPEGFDENDMEIAKIQAICIDSSNRVNLLTLIEHPGGYDFIHYFPLKDVFKHPGKKFKIPGAISEYIIFDKHTIVDIAQSIILGYISLKLENNRKNQRSATSTPQKQEISQSKYTSIAQFKRDFPEKEIYRILVKLGADKKRYKATFKKDLFDNMYDELGNDWNSYIESINIAGPNKIEFEIYMAGDSTDDTEIVSYDEFTKNSGNVTIRSQIARVNATYDERIRLKILNKILILLKDAENGKGVFYNLK